MAQDRIHVQSQNSPFLPCNSCRQTSDSTTLSVLNGVRVLVALASYDFSQLPHLEEVLDAYHDLCVAGAKVDVFVHTTEPYPVSLIDLLNSRLTCTNPSPNAGLQITIVLKSPSLRLNLVDCHRKLFYERIDEYDLFIYSEDDIRVTPKTVASYIHETNRVKELVGGEKAASDFNVGIVRYEYNYPPEIIIDDKTRHATRNVTRVYWEHRGDTIVPDMTDAVPQKPLSGYYVHMMNHHQGMFLATRQLLKAWKERPGCEFDVIRQRPGMKNNPHQPSEGTQRVWMSSVMLYGSRHCNVQQVLPMDNFGSLTVLHLPNKNYRRVGKKGRLGGDKEGATPVEFSNGSEKFETADKSLPTAMQVHLAIRKQFPAKPSLPYTGIQMVNEIEGGRFNGAHRTLVEKRMRAYEDYKARGGVLKVSDMDDAI